MKKYVLTNNKQLFLCGNYTATTTMMMRTVNMLVNTSREHNFKHVGEQNNKHM